MYSGIALTLAEVPTVIVDQVPGRLVQREGRPELRFLMTDRPPLLPVRWRGEFHLLRWGSRSQQKSVPYGYWLSEEWNRSGALDWAKPEPVVIPANLGFDRGTWFLIDEGIFGIVFPDVADGPLVYMLTKRSTNYYRNMTGQKPTMPCFVRQTI